MIGIIDYGLGNLSSVLNAFNTINCHAEIFDNPKNIKKYKRLVLPGVGSFEAGIKALKIKNWPDGIYEHVKLKKPLLGICLGMQLLFTKGEEYGVHDGLGLINGVVKKMKIKNHLKLPHVGWNNLINMKSHPLFKDIANNIDFYFVHSHECIPDNDNSIIAECNYGNNFAACVSKQNIFGTQFHPEKSAPSGIILLKNFNNWQGELYKKE